MGIPRELHKDAQLASWVPKGEGTGTQEAPGLVVHTCYSSTRETAARGLIRVQGLGGTVSQGMRDTVTA